MSENVSEEIKFSALFPLPFRVLVLGGIGILGWATNLHGLNLLGIDAAAALELNTHNQGQRLVGPDYSAAESTLPTSRTGWRAMADPSSVYVPVYKLFLQYSLLTLIGWTLYLHATHGDVELVDIFKFVPAVTMLIMAMALVSPFNVLGKRDRDHFI